MTLDRKIFFDEVRATLFGGTLDQGQVQGIDVVLDEWERRKLTDLRWLAYMLATVKWETNATMQAVREAYWLSEDWRRTHLRYYPYYGRGLVQLTWLANYQKMGAVLGVDLVTYPDLALGLDIAVQILFEGMTNGETGVGDFTGLSLEKFFNELADDPINARRIINGLDRTVDIAKLYYKFLSAVKNASVSA